MATTTTATRRAPVPHRAVHHHPATPAHHRHFFGSIGHGIGNAARGVGHAAQHALNGVLHHPAASAGLLALVGIVVAATVARTLVRERMMRLAHWMGVPRVGPPPPGPMD